MLTAVYSKPVESAVSFTTNPSALSADGIHSSGTRGKRSCKRSRRTRHQQRQHGIPPPSLSHAAPYPILKVERVASRHATVWLEESYRDTKLCQDWQLQRLSVVVWLRSENRASAILQHSRHCFLFSFAHFPATDTLVKRMHPH